MKMMLRAVRPRLRVLWTRHWTGAGKNLPWAWKERPILNLSCLLLQFKKAYLLSAPPGRLRRGLEDPEESANKSKELSFGLTFMMRARAKEWQKSGDETILFLGDKLSKRWCLGPKLHPKNLYFLQWNFLHRCSETLRTQCLKVTKNHHSITYFSTEL